nr:zonadhesin-like protein 2B [Limnephilus flavicornis]
MRFVILTALVLCAQIALSSAGGYPPPTKAPYGPPATTKPRTKPPTKPPKVTTTKPTTQPPPPTCRPKEVLSECGANDCQNTCANPSASEGTCPCKPGCICQEGLIRNSKGLCVEPEDCDTCKENEKFSKCGNNDCQDTCTNPKASTGTCPCKPGCICADGYMKNTKGECVVPEKCDVCKDREVFSKCGNNNCQNTCDSPDKSSNCQGDCEPGCLCTEGNIKDNTGVCIPPSECEHFCKNGEEYTKCNNYPCRRTCEYPNGVPGCNPSPDCYPGCVCKAGTLMNNDGVCVPEGECAYNCPGPYETFNFCGTACPKTCDNKDKNIACILLCVKGCFCQEGYVRDKNNKCILPKDCPPPPPPTCKTNEVYDKCPPTSPAELTCTNIFKGTKPAHPNPCQPGCKCKQGYVRVGKDCVVEGKCCTDANSELVKNPPCCGGGTCAKPDWITGCGKKSDPKGCQCKKGYCKKSETDATCIAVKDCKKPVPLPYA